MEWKIINEHDIQWLCGWEKFGEEGLGYQKSCTITRLGVNAAKYQFDAQLLEKEEIINLIDNNHKHTQGKHGDKDFLLTLMYPEDLLKMAFVHVNKANQNNKDGSKNN